MRIFRIRAGCCSIWTKVTHTVLCGLCFVQGTKCFLQDSYSCGELKGKFKKKSPFPLISVSSAELFWAGWRDLLPIVPWADVPPVTPHPHRAPCTNILGCCSRCTWPEMNGISALLLMDSLTHSAHLATSWTLWEPVSHTCHQQFHGLILGLFVSWSPGQVFTHLFSVCYLPSTCMCACVTEKLCIDLKFGKLLAFES